MLFTLLLPVTASSVDNYAVIMCGSKGWSNYRHQADVYAWRRVLINRGFSPSNIITLSFNDVPYSESQNGSIYHTCNGPDIYEPIINYTGADANKQNFFKVLSSIPSGKGGLFKREVNVLVVYINHGAYDLLSTPNAFDQPIYVDEFGEVVNELSTRVARVFCILEACHSGTIAMHAKYNKNVIFMTAANPKQSSYSHGYCERLGVFTTNEMTYHLLNYLDNSDNDERSVNDMIAYVKQQTNMSSVVRSGTTNRILLKEFFRVIGKRGVNGTLGNVTVNVKARRRNINSLNNERLIGIYNRIRRTLAANIDIAEIELTSQIQCRKRISASAMQLFVDEYLHEDNIEFLNKMGDLCKDFSYEDISTVMVVVRDSLTMRSRYNGDMGRKHRHRRGYN